MMLLRKKRLGEKVCEFFHWEFAALRTCSYNCQKGSRVPHCDIQNVEILGVFSQRNLTHRMHVLRIAS